VSEIAEFAVSCGHSAVAITDIGNMFGVVPFFNECKKAGVKPIIGAQLDIKSTLGINAAIFLVRNTEGYANLVNMVSNMGRGSNVDAELVEQSAAGLIALSMSDSAAFNAWMKEFLDEDFYITLPAELVERGGSALSDRVQLATNSATPLVATGSVRYLRTEDEVAARILSCVAERALFDAAQSVSGHHYRSTEEMTALFRDYPAAIENTVLIADKCDFEFDFSARHMPLFSLPQGENSAKDYLIKQAENGITRLIERRLVSADQIENYRVRMTYEATIIDRMGFNDYFLVVADFVAWARENDISVGPGRGSGCGSLIAFLLGITEVDSLAHGLLFERFLNPERSSMPDFDIDFCYLRRDEVIEYVRQKYGADHVACVCAHGTFGAKAAVRDAGRILALPDQVIGTVARLIGWHSTIKSTLEQEPKLVELQRTSRDVTYLLQLARTIEGMPRHVTTHAAGVIITGAPVGELMPTCYSGDVMLTQYDKDVSEQLGFVKFDFLGLRYLTIVAQAAKSAEVRLEPQHLALDDKATFRLIGSGQTAGLFQLESPGMRRLLTRMKPNKLDDLIAALALYRPGPMEFIPKFLENRALGNRRPAHPIPAVEQILAPTAGCITYQEQVMEILHDVAGYSYGKGDIVRRLMAGRKLDQLENERSRFVAAAVARTPELTEKSAAELFDFLLKFAGYAFPKAHAAAYAVISYHTAYLKANHPSCYMAALMTPFGANREYLEDYAKVGVTLRPPCINTSGVDFFPANSREVLFALCAIKHMNHTFASKIVTERVQNGNFTDLHNFVERVEGLNKNQLHALIASGAFDCFGKTRSSLDAACDQLLDSVSADARGKIEGQMGLFGAAAVAPQVYPDLPEFPLAKLIAMQREACGAEFNRASSRHKTSSSARTEVKKLYLRIDKLSSAQHMEALKLFESFRGDDIVIFFDCSTSSYHPTDRRIDASEVLLEQLRVLLGEENVVIK